MTQPLIGRRLLSALCALCVVIYTLYVVTAASPSTLHSRGCAFRGYDDCVKLT